VAGLRCRCCSALDAYAGRERRFGLTSAQSPGRTSSMTKTRVLAALIMAPLAIAAILLLPTAMAGRRRRAVF
jgi:hypothetical protein